MPKLSHFFILLLICNATYISHAMDHWNEHYQQTKDLTRQKKEREKKHRQPQSKKRNDKKSNTKPKETTK